MISVLQLWRFVTVVFFSIVYKLSYLHTYCALQHIYAMHSKVQIITDFTTTDLVSNILHSDCSSSNIKKFCDSEQLYYKIISMVKITSRSSY